MLVADSKTSFRVTETFLNNLFLFSYNCFFVLVCPFVLMFPFFVYVVLLQDRISHFELINCGVTLFVYFLNYPLT